jgi:hypothetical protein
MAKRNGFVEVIREGIRDTVHDTLRSVVREATEQELRTALRDEDIRKAILDLIRQELQETLRGLAPKSKSSTRSARP